MAIQDYVYFEEMKYVDGLLTIHNPKTEILGTEAVLRLAKHAKKGKPQIIETVTERDGIAVTMFRFPAWDVEVTGMTAEDLRQVYRAATKAAPRVTKGGCSRCGGTGIYVWGAIVNGVPTHQGVCFRCLGSGDEKRPGTKLSPKAARPTAAGLACENCGGPLDHESLCVDRCREDGGQWPREEEKAPKRRATGKNRPTISKETLAALVRSGQMNADQASLYLPR